MADASDDNGSSGGGAGGGRGRGRGKQRAQQAQSAAPPQPPAPAAIAAPAPPLPATAGRQQAGWTARRGSSGADDVDAIADGLGAMSIGGAERSNTGGSGGRGRARRPRSSRGATGGGAGGQSKEPGTGAGRGRGGRGRGRGGGDRGGHGRGGRGRGRGEGGRGRGEGGRGRGEGGRGRGGDGRGRGKGGKADKAAKKARPAIAVELAQLTAKKVKVHVPTACKCNAVQRVPADDRRGNFVLSSGGSYYCVLRSEDLPAADGGDGAAGGAGGAAAGASLAQQYRADPMGVERRLWSAVKDTVRADQEVCLASCGLSRKYPNACVVYVGTTAGLNALTADFNARPRPPGCLIDRAERLVAVLLSSLSYAALMPLLRAAAESVDAERGTAWKKLEVSSHLRRIVDARVLPAREDLAIIATVAYKPSVVELSLPGGKRNLGEQLWECAARECLEESEIDVSRCLPEGLGAPAAEGFRVEVLHLPGAGDMAMCVVMDDGDADARSVPRLEGLLKARHADNRVPRSATLRRKDLAPRAASET